jgi:phenylacetate-coenzyme A ligase PaaK-like adenylate-forming protein
MELVSRNQLPPALGALRFTQETMFDFQIRNIENQTGLPVFGSYGSEELSGVLAHSCRHGVYHVHPLIGHVEIVNDDGLPVDPGDEGRILATSFINRCMPFIRYDTGDIATSLGTDYVCPCGCPYPVFGSLQVSRKYLIPKRSGGEYSDALIAQHLIRDTGDTAPFIEGFYLQQDGEWQWDMMLLLRNNADSEDIISRMQERANRLFKNEVDITVRICHELPRTRTGKRRTVIFQDEH